jgi:hypothetical protein
MAYSDVLCRQSVHGPEVSDVNMAGFGSSGSSPILLELYGALVVLFKPCCRYLMSSRKCFAQMAFGW